MKQIIQLLLQVVFILGLTRADDDHPNNSKPFIKTLSQHLANEQIHRQIR